MGREPPVAIVGRETAQVYDSLHTVGRGGAAEAVGEQEVEIRARVRRLSGFSGHGDQRQMIDYVQAFRSPPKRVVLVHGEPTAGPRVA